MARTPRRPTKVAWSRRALLASAASAASAVAVVIGAASLGCADAAVRPSDTAPSSGNQAGPALLPQIPVPVPGAASALMPGAPPSQVASAPGDAGGFDPASIVRVIDEPRLASVRAAIEREAFKEAADDLEAKLADPSKLQATPLTPGDVAALRYQLGELRTQAGDPLAAAKAYDESAAAGGLLADYARFAAADILEKAGQHDAALERAKAITAGLPIAKDVELITADALAGKNDVDGAAAAYRAFLGRQPRSPQWIPVTLRFAKLLLRKATEERAEEAIRLARRVAMEGSNGEGAGEAKAIEEEALGVLPFARRKAFENAGVSDLLSKARALVGAGQSREAMAALDALAKLPAGKSAMEKPSGDVACEAAAIRAEALGKLKRKAESADAYGEAIEKCAGQSRRVEVLYNAGRAAEKASRAAEVVKRFAMLEAEFPKHRLADDARLRGAKAALEMGDEARFTKMLSEMPDAYPDGDMVTDGLFELALARIEKRDWAGAVVPLEKALARAPRERAYFTAGRLPYFLGRARIETGAVDKGKELLASVIRGYPLTYYMALAYARLSERDAAAAKAALDAAAASEPAGPFVLPKSPEFEKPAFLRAVALARQGEARLARGELDALGLSARTAPPEVLWASVFLLARAGSPTLSHKILSAATFQSSSSKVELTDWLDHYPVGRWRAAWEAAYPRPFAPIITAEAKRSQIPEALALGIMREESAFDPRVTSHAAAHGLMQLIVPTAKIMAKSLNLPASAESLKRPEINVALGCRFLSTLRAKFPDNPMLAVPSYNAGAGAPIKWIAKRPTNDFDVWVERIPYQETREYTKRVMTSMTAYEFLYTRDQPSEALSTPLAASAQAAAAAAGAGRKAGEATADGAAGAGADPSAGAAADDSP